jgi:hypothetical protein
MSTEGFQNYLNTPEAEFVVLYFDAEASSEEEIAKAPEFLNNIGICKSFSNLKLARGKVRNRTHFQPSSPR